MLARAAARAAGHAVATAHMADHALGAVVYGVKAVKLAAPPAEAKTAGEREHQWQREHLPEAIRELVVSALEQKTVLAYRTPKIQYSGTPLIPRIPF